MIIPSATMLRISVILCCLSPVILGAVQHPDASVYFEVPNPQELIEQAGYIGETHEVVTEDRYVLQLHRIPGSKQNPPSDKKPAVLLLHGLLDCSATWVLTDPGKSLAFQLSNWGYDVWLGNERGNRYSRRHLDFTVSDHEYWLFSWHEMGVYDIPAMIDYILGKTNQKKIFLVSHSQGGTAFFVMASERPEYQKKIVASFTLAPAVFMSRSRNPFFRMLAPHANDIGFLADLIGMYEFKPSNKLIQMLAKELCHDESLLQPMCKNIVFLVAGMGDKDFNSTLLPVIGQYDPAGTSTRQVVHYGQSISTGKFRKYDYGLVKNLKKYGKIHPPDYDLANIKLPVYIYYSTNDALVDDKDSYDLYCALPNAQHFLVPSEYFTHLDFVWGKHADVWVYNKILSLMERYRK
ncbi:lipase 3 [Xylocopa sonorina]|uniref:lipase 3 n=1 Tax=Xylocopa sonorina TaxID=1818115 RepID=UPI00403B08A1